MSDVKRVFVWSMPRSLGTAFVKCMSYVDGIQIFNEPFCCAYHFGPEAVLKPQEIDDFMGNATSVSSTLQLEHAFDDNLCTYDWVKEQLSADYPEKKVLLVKDQAYCLQNRYDMIPDGFRHVFLIRHPCKVLPSWNRMMSKLLQIDQNLMAGLNFMENVLNENIYLNIANLFRHVKDNLDPDAVLIDADDLTNDPASILSQLCKAVGIYYEDSLLEWPGGCGVIKSWKASRVSLQGNLLEKEGGFYEAALMSTKFNPPKPVPKLSELIPDLQTQVNESMPHYKSLLESRLKP